MWPWGHLAVGYLAYVVLIKLRSTGEQTWLTLLAVAFGTQFPDLVDKPLAWSFEILPSGRSLAHSLITATLVIGILYWVGRRVGREDVVTAFSVGYVSHCFADLGPRVLLGLAQGDMSQLTWTTYLLWPVLPSPPYTSDDSFVQHFLAFEFSSYVIVQFVLVVVAVGVWVAVEWDLFDQARQQM